MCILQVYDTLIARGVPPHISQYNALMEQYALRYQLGNVVSLLTTMVGGGIAPNANTFRCGLAIFVVTHVEQCYGCCHVWLWNVLLAMIVGGGIALNASTCRCDSAILEVTHVEQ
jgi:hypothetical protein